MKRVALLVAALFATPLRAQEMEHHHMHAPAPAEANAGPPPVAQDRAADRFHDPAAMARAEAGMMRAHQASSYHRILFNLAEYQVRDGRDGYRWEAEAWFGDVDRLVVRTQGEGGFGNRLDKAELQILYSKALDPWWNLQLGIRHDIRPSPSRTYATLGVEGLAPGRIDLHGALFMSEKGDVLARVEAGYDQRLTGRFILQPRLELDFAAQDVPENRVGAGFSEAELGLRLRYEAARQFAPYAGLSWTWKAGRTANFARAAGEGVNEAGIVIGVRTWF